jgi:hypothetical protein
MTGTPLLRLSDPGDGLTGKRAAHLIAAMTMDHQHLTGLK